MFGKRIPAGAPLTEVVAPCRALARATRQLQSLAVPTAVASSNTLAVQHAHPCTPNLPSLLPALPLPHLQVAAAPLLAFPTPLLALPDILVPCTANAPLSAASAHCMRMNARFPCPVCPAQASETFLQRMMALYVASHYKNTPNDLMCAALCCAVPAVPWCACWAPL